jgi:hypothetical protein
MVIKGLTEQETALLKMIGVTTPWRRDKVSKAVGRYLDGHTDTIKGAPALTEKLEEILEKAKPTPRQRLAQNLVRRIRYHNNQV